MVLLLNHPFVPFAVYTIVFVCAICWGKMSKIKIYVIKRSCVENLNVPPRSPSVKALWVSQWNGLALRTLKLCLSRRREPGMVSSSGPSLSTRGAVSHSLLSCPRSHSLLGRLTGRDAGVWPGHLSPGWTSPKGQLSSTLPVGLVEAPWGLLTVVLLPLPSLVSFHPRPQPETSGHHLTPLLTHLHLRVHSLEAEPSRGTEQGLERVGTWIQFIDEKPGAQRGLDTCPKCPSEVW